MEGRHVLEDLCDENKDVEIQGDHGRNDVGASPGAVQTTAIKREDGYGEDNQREDAEDDPWSRLRVREAKPGDAGQNRRDEEQTVPHGEQLAAKKTGKHDEPRRDTDETDNDVHRGVGCQAHSEYHAVPLSSGEE
jgi:hypothetical protein